MKVFFVVGWLEHEGQSESKKLMQLLRAKKQSLFEAYTAVDSKREQAVTITLDGTYFVELSALAKPDATYLEMIGAVEEEMIDALLLSHQKDSESPMMVGRIYEIGKQNNITEVKAD